MKKFVIMAACVSLCAMPAFANKDKMSDGAGKGERMGDRFFEKADTNKDGKISKAENEALAQKRFEEADANKDGALTKEEMKAHHMKKKEEHMSLREKMHDKLKPAAGGEKTPHKDTKPETEEDGQQ